MGNSTIAFDATFASLGSLPEQTISTNTPIIAIPDIQTSQYIATSYNNTIRNFDATISSFGELPEQTISTIVADLLVNDSLMRSTDLIISNLPNTLVDARLANSWTTRSVREFDPIINDYGPFPPNQETNLIPPVYRPNNTNYPDALNLDIGSIWSETRPFLTFHSSGFNNFYDAQIASTGGTNIDGHGNLTYTADTHTFIGDVLVQNADAPGEAVSFGQMQETLNLLNARLAEEDTRIQELIESVVQDLASTNFAIHREVIEMNRVSSMVGNEKYYGITTYPISGTPSSLIINFLDGDDVEYMGLYSITGNRFEITSSETVNKYTASVTYLRKV